MADKQWYIGPLGNLRPLVCPEVDVTINGVRYGGVHQGLSGARTMDITGYRNEYELGFRWLTENEFNWLEALHTRLVPGPFRLLNPLKRNRLTEQSTVGTPTTILRSGTYLPTTFTRDYDWPAEVPYPARSIKVPVNEASALPVRFDYRKPTAVFPEETITASVYLKSLPVAVLGRLVIDTYDFQGNKTGSLDGPDFSLTTSWQRITLTQTVPAGTAGVTFAMVLYADATAPEFLFAAPQLEGGATATEWQIGGGAPEVLIDQLPTTSPRFPLRDASFTLLET